MAVASAKRLAAAIGRARERLDACRETAEANYQKESERIRHEAEARSDQLQQHWNQAVNEAETMRNDLQRHLDAKLSRATARNDQLLQHGLERLQQERAHQVGRWKHELEAERARLEVDVERLSGALPDDQRLALPGAARFSLPLLLTFPDRGSILFETKESGREPAIAALNNLVLRLLSGAPPGRVVFTILDPLDLGQSFAGLMHLTDHEDRLINRRIWTQPDHIEQRLAELNEHIEKVTQLYLRNEYETIADYNEQAGRIAEPYH